MTRSSLKFRIIAMSGAWIFLALFATALLLLYYYYDHIAEHYDAHLLMHLEEMVVAAQLNQDGSLELAYQPSDPRFDMAFSGWYWEIRQQGRILESSRSLAGTALDLEGLEFAPGRQVHLISGPHQQDLRVQLTQLAAGPDGESLMLVASAPATGITEEVVGLAWQMLFSFFILGLLLTLAVVVQVRVALRPLHEIGSGIAEIREGHAEKLRDEFPEDVQPLVYALNNLIEHNAVLLKRARNRLGDLAHAIKNPLSVIRNEAQALEGNQQQLILRQADDIANSVDNYLFRARASGSEKVLGSNVMFRSVAEDLVFALERIYQDRELEFDLSGLGKCSFRGETQDLEEMLGNLMDNACKWARKRVIVHCSSGSNRCRLVVEDDGPGIPEEHIERVLSRGERLDPSVEGSGLGLGIVRDIVSLYNGKLSFNRSVYSGLSAELELPGS